MPLSEQEEFELLSLEREKAMHSAPQASQADVRRVDNAMAKPEPSPVYKALATF